MKIPIIRLDPPDARGWIGLGSYVLVLIVLAMIETDRSLLHDDFFKVIATAIVLTAWNNGPVGWAFGATKVGGELAANNAELVKRQADPAVPQRVEVEQPSDKPIPTTDVG